MLNVLSILEVAEYLLSTGVFIRNYFTFKLGLCQKICMVFLFKMHEFNHWSDSFAKNYPTRWYLREHFSSLPPNNLYCK